jgi:glycine oxidase
LSVGFKRNGSLMVMMKSGEPNTHGRDSDVSLIDAAQTHALEPLIATNIAGALWAPKEAVVDTHALARALAAAFIAAGGKLSLNETAVLIETDGKRVMGVRTPFHFREADAYILAADAWTSRLEGLPSEAVPPVIPIKGEILVLTPPRAADLPKHTVWGNEIYVVPRGNQLLVGATAEQVGFDTAKTQQAFDWLRRQSTGLMPALGDWDVAEHWVGLRPASPDGLPIIGQSEIEGLYVASGQYRNGILFAPAVADVLCRLVLERVTDMPAFDPRRFKGSQACMPGSIVETAHRAPEGHPEYQPWLIGF